VECALNCLINGLPVITSLRLSSIRVINYLTNHVVNHMPSYRIRLAWYRSLGVRVGEGSAIHLNCYFWFFGPGQVRRVGVTIGANTRINRGCCIDGRGELAIGNNVSISPEVAIITTQHEWRSLDFCLQSEPVVIEDHVWIGMRATVLPGTTVGHGSVIAAGAVASGHIPAFSVVAGVPARVVAQRPEQAARYVLNARSPLFE
jgi:acetyltransferase-like isoleucine patch superfamily enzyme